MAAAVSGLNHLTLAVGDLDRSLIFYRDVLGFRLAAVWATGAYLEAGALWLCLSVGPVSPRDDYSHAALNVAKEAFAELAERVSAVAPVWQANVSEGESLYFLDPDGHRLELHVGSLRSRLADYRGRAVPEMRVFGKGLAAAKPRPTSDEFGWRRASRLAARACACRRAWLRHTRSRRYANGRQCFHWRPLCRANVRSVSTPALRAGSHLRRASRHFWVEGRCP